MESPDFQVAAHDSLILKHGSPSEKHLFALSELRGRALPAAADCQASALSVQEPGHPSQAEATRNSRALMKLQLERLLVGKSFQEKSGGENSLRAGVVEER